MPQRIYIETTVWYQMVNYADSEFKEMAKRLFKLIERERFETFISNTVLEEISYNSPKYRDRLEDLISKYKPAVLVQNAEAEDIASAYIENAFRHRVRSEVLVDAHHAATATVANISYVASYNYRNLLSVKAVENFNAVNLLAGYNHFLSIVPPFMFLDLVDYNGEHGVVDDKVWGIKNDIGEKLEDLLCGSPSARIRHYSDVARKAEKRLGIKLVQINS
jgi:predicted nucleic acid-binding protein